MLFAAWWLLLPTPLIAAAATPPPNVAVVAPAAREAEFAWGPTLAGVGAALLVTTPVAVTLVESLGAPDDGRNPSPRWIEDFTQGSGLFVLATTAVGAVALATGGAWMLLDTLEDKPAPASAATMPVMDTPTTPPTQTAPSAQ
jgi:hypothetical protein